MQGVLERVATTAGADATSPLLSANGNDTKDLLVVVTSDRGLCGGFNSALLRKTEDFIAKKAKDGISCDILVYGRKGKDYLSARKYDLNQTVLDYAKNNKMDLVRDLSDTVVHAYTNGEYGRIYLVSNEFVNVMIQNPQFQQVLPLSVDTSNSEEHQLEYQYEPSPNEILDSLLPLYLRTLLLKAFGNRGR